MRRELSSLPQYEVPTLVCTRVGYRMKWAWSPLTLHSLFKVQFKLRDHQQSLHSDFFSRLVRVKLKKVEPLDSYFEFDFLIKFYDA